MGTAVRKLPFSAPLCFHFWTRPDKSCFFPLGFLVLKFQTISSSFDHCFPYTVLPTFLIFIPPISILDQFVEGRLGPSTVVLDHTSGFEGLLLVDDDLLGVSIKAWVFYPLGLGCSGSVGIPAPFCFFIFLIYLWFWGQCGDKTTPVKLLMINSETALGKYFSFSILSLLNFSWKCHKFH